MVRLGSVRAINLESHEGDDTQPMEEMLEAQEARVAARYEQGLRLISQGKERQAQEQFRLILQDPFLQASTCQPEGEADRGGSGSGHAASRVQLRYLTLKNLAGLLWEERGSEEEALRLFAEAVLYDQDDVLMWHKMARLAWRKGRLAMARNCCEQGLRRSTRHPLLLRLLLQVLQEVGDAEAAGLLRSHITQLAGPLKRPRLVERASPGRSTEDAPPELHGSKRSRLEAAPDDAAEREEQAGHTPWLVIDLARPSWSELLRQLLRRLGARPAVAGRSGGGAAERGGKQGWEAEDAIARPVMVDLQSHAAGQQQEAPPQDQAAAAGDALPSTGPAAAEQPGQQQREAGAADGAEPCCAASEEQAQPGDKQKKSPCRDAAPLEAETGDKRVDAAGQPAGENASQAEDVPVSGAEGETEGAETGAGMGLDEPSSEAAASDADQTPAAVVEETAAASGTEQQAAMGSDVHTGDDGEAAAMRGQAEEAVAPAESGEAAAAEGGEAPDPQDGGAAAAEGGEAAAAEGGGPAAAEGGEAHAEAEAEAEEGGEQEPLSPEKKIPERASRRIRQLKVRDMMASWSARMDLDDAGQAEVVVTRNVLQMVGDPLHADGCFGLRQLVQDASPVAGLTQSSGSSPGEAAAAGAAAAAAPQGTSAEHAEAGKKRRGRRRLGRLLDCWGSAAPQAEETQADEGVARLRGSSLLAVATQVLTQLLQDPGLTLPRDLLPLVLQLGREMAACRLPAHCRLFLAELHLDAAAAAAAAAARMRSSSGAAGAAAKRGANVGGPSEGAGGEAGGNPPPGADAPNKQSVEAHVAASREHLAQALRMVLANQGMERSGAADDAAASPGEAWTRCDAGRVDAGLSGDACTPGPQSATGLQCTLGQALLATLHCDAALAGASEGDGPAGGDEDAMQVDLPEGPHVPPSPLLSDDDADEPGSDPQASASARPAACSSAAFAWRLPSGAWAARQMQDDAARAFWARFHWCSCRALSLPSQWQPARSGKAAAAGGWEQLALQHLLATLLICRGLPPEAAAAGFSDSSKAGAQAADAEAGEAAGQTARRSADAAGVEEGGRRLVAAMKPLTVQLANCVYDGEVSQQACGLRHQRLKLGRLLASSRDLLLTRRHQELLDGLLPYALSANLKQLLPGRKEPWREQLHLYDLTLTAAQRAPHDHSWLEALCCAEMLHIMLPPLGAAEDWSPDMLAQHRSPITGTAPPGMKPPPAADSKLMRRVLPSLLSAAQRLSRPLLAAAAAAPRPEAAAAAPAAAPAEAAGELGQELLAGLEEQQRVRAGTERGGLQVQGLLLRTMLLLEQFYWALSKQRKKPAGGAASAPPGARLPKGSKALSAMRDGLACTASAVAGLVGVGSVLQAPPEAGERMLSSLLLLLADRSAVMSCGGAFLRQAVSLMFVSHALLTRRLKLLEQSADEQPEGAAGEPGSLEPESRVGEDSPREQPPAREESGAGRADEGCSPAAAAEAEAEAEGDAQAGAGPHGEDGGSAATADIAAAEPEADADEPAAEPPPEGRAGSEHAEEEEAMEEDGSGSGSDSEDGGEASLQPSARERRVEQLREWEEQHRGAISQSLWYLYGLDLPRRQDCREVWKLDAEQLGGSQAGRATAPPGEAPPPEAGHGPQPGAGDASRTTDEAAQASASAPAAGRGALSGPAAARANTSGLSSQSICCEIWPFLSEEALRLVDSQQTKRLGAMRAVLEAIEKHFPEPPKLLLQSSVPGAVLDSCMPSNEQLLEANAPPAAVQPPALDELGIPIEHQEVYGSLYYILSRLDGGRAAVPALLAAHGGALAVAGTSGSDERVSPEEFVAAAVAWVGSLELTPLVLRLRHDLCFNPGRASSWRTLGEVYEEAAESLSSSAALNCAAGSCAGLPELVALLGRLRGRAIRCAAVCRQLSRQQGDLEGEVDASEAVASAYFELAQDLPPMFNQRWLSPRSAASWHLALQASHKALLAASAIAPQLSWQRLDWKGRWLMGKLAGKMKPEGWEKVQLSSFALANLYAMRIHSGGALLAPLYYLHAARLKQLLGPEPQLHLIARYCFLEQTRTKVEALLKSAADRCSPTLPAPDDQHAATMGRDVDAALPTEAGGAGSAPGADSKPGAVAADAMDTDAELADAGGWEEAARQLLLEDGMEAMQFCFLRDRRFHKARYRLARALHGLGRRREACEVMKDMFCSDRRTFDIAMQEICDKQRRPRRSTLAGTVAGSGAGEPSGAAGAAAPLGLVDVLSLPEHLWGLRPARISSTGLDETPRKYVAALRRYLQFYLRLLVQLPDLRLLHQVALGLHGGAEAMRGSWAGSTLPLDACLSDIAHLALGRYAQELAPALHAAFGVQAPTDGSSCSGEASGALGRPLSAEQRTALLRAAGGSGQPQLGEEQAALLQQAYELYATITAGGLQGDGGWSVSVRRAVLQAVQDAGPRHCRRSVDERPRPRPLHGLTEEDFRAAALAHVDALRGRLDLAALKALADAARKRMRGGGGGGGAAAAAPAQRELRGLLAEAVVDVCERLATAMEAAVPALLAGAERTELPGCGGGEWSRQRVLCELLTMAGVLKPPRFLASWLCAAARPPCTAAALQAPAGSKRDTTKLLRDSLARSLWSYCRIAPGVEKVAGDERAADGIVRSMNLDHLLTVVDRLAKQVKQQQQGAAAAPALPVVLLPGAVLSAAPQPLAAPLAATGLSAAQLPQQAAAAPQEPPAAPPPAAAAAAAAVTAAATPLLTADADPAAAAPTAGTSAASELQFPIRPTSCGGAEPAGHSACEPEVVELELELEPEEEGLPAQQQPQAEEPQDVDSGGPHTPHGTDAVQMAAVPPAEAEPAGTLLQRHRAVAPAAAAPPLQSPQPSLPSWIPAAPPAPSVLAQMLPAPAARAAQSGSAHLQAQPSQMPPGPLSYASGAEHLLPRIPHLLQQLQQPATRPADAAPAALPAPAATLLLRQMLARQQPAQLQVAASEPAAVPGMLPWSLPLLQQLPRPASPAGSPLPPALPPGFGAQPSIQARLAGIAALLRQRLPSGSSAPPAFPPGSQPE